MSVSFYIVHNSETVCFLLNLHLNLYYINNIFMSYYHLSILLFVCIWNDLWYFYIAINKNKIKITQSSLKFTVFNKITNAVIKGNLMWTGDLFEKWILTIDINIVLFTSKISFHPDNINLKQLVISFTWIWIVCEK